MYFHYSTEYFEYKNMKFFMVFVTTRKNKFSKDLSIIVIIIPLHVVFSIHFSDIFIKWYIGFIMM